MPSVDTGWNAAFSAHVASGELDAAIALLDAMATGHAGTAPQTVKHAAIRNIRTVLGPGSPDTCDIGLAWAMSANATAKEIGISLLPPFYDTAPGPINERFLHTGDDDNWEVREWAASALAHVISGHFDAVQPELRRWAAHTSPNARRMVVVASGYAMRDCSPSQCQHLLSLLTPLLADPDPYVGKNLGAFALGSYAIRYQPDLVARWTTELDLDDERTAWNLAMMFTTAEGAKSVDRFASLLARLSQDDRKRVRAAVRKASANMARRNGQPLSSPNASNGSPDV